MSRPKSPLRNPCLIVFLRILILKKYTGEYSPREVLPEKIAEIAKQMYGDRQTPGLLKRWFLLENFKFNFSVRSLERFVSLVRTELKVTSFIAFEDKWKNKGFVKKYNERYKFYSDIPIDIRLKIEVWAIKECDKIFTEINAVDIPTNEKKEKSDNSIETNQLKDISIKGNIISQEFWEYYKLPEQDKIDQLKYFYINPAYSNIEIILKVIANDFYIKPENTNVHEIFPEESTHENLETVLNLFENKNNFRCLVKITGFGGSGKTTYLWHLAKQYCEKYKTIYLDILDPHSIQVIASKLSQDESLLILVDSVKGKNNDSNQLFDFFRILRKIDKVFFIISERDNWLKDFELFFGINNYFDHLYEVHYNNSVSRKKALNIFIESLNKYANIETKYLDERIKSIFLDETLSLVEAKYLLLAKLKTTKNFNNQFHFEWEDWLNYTTSSLNEKKYSSLKYLYHFVAAFQQFGLRIPITLNFNKIFNTENINYGLLINEVCETFPKGKSPILIGNDFVLLRHDMLGELLIKTSSKHEINIVKEYIRNLFKNIFDQTGISLFLNMDKPGFITSKLFDEYCDLTNAHRIFQTYLKNIPEKDYTKIELKCLKEWIYWNSYDNSKLLLKLINKLISIEKNGSNYLKKNSSYFGMHMLGRFHLFSTRNYPLSKKILYQIKDKEPYVLRSIGDYYSITGDRPPVKKISSKLGEMITFEDRGIIIYENF